MRSVSVAALFVIGIFTALPSVAAGQTAPQGMRGKTIIIAWTEHRSQRQLGEANFRDIVNPLSWTIYISTVGRPFSRYTTLGVDRRAYRRTASSESVGTSGTSLGGAIREILFKNGSLVAMRTVGGGYARRITVDFNESYSTCDAQVIFAKEPGKDIVVGRNMFTGRPMEIRSGTVSSVSCLVREGNVFSQ